MVVSAAYGTTAEARKRLPATGPAPTRASTPIADASATPTVATARPIKDLIALPRPELTRAVPVGPAAVFANVGGVQLVHPAARVERIGFHQASDVNSLELQPAPTAVRPKIMPSRHRRTASSSAADIVVHPQSEIRAPVSGTVKRAGNYKLYCKTPDSFVVISPDGHPGLEVKLLHISGLRVRPGDRVEAGTTLLAKRPTMLPFGSQVDAFSAHRAWPHVHLEVTRLTEPSATPLAGPSTLAFGRCG